MFAFGVLNAASLVVMFLPAPLPWIAGGAAFVAILALLDAWIVGGSRLTPVRVSRA